MAVRRLRSLALSMGALGTLLVMQGCADDGVSLHVICPIVPMLMGKTCVYDPTSTTCVSEGLLNLGSANSYNLFVKVDSGLKPRAREVPPQSEPNGLQVTSATVELRLPTGEVLGFVGKDKSNKDIKNPSEVPATGYIPPAGSAAVSVTLISEAQVAQLLDTSKQPSVPKFPQLIASIKIKGTTNGQQEVESGEWVWPIRLDYASPLVADAECSKMDFCRSSVGQDFYAYSCIDVPE
ncbi:MAG: hypothetical protein JWN48_2660 [Myxococcaceae bacterium]|nr:hypothetical protein [Myxococcaceae bacterium]